MHDAELLRSGAEYVADSEGGYRFEVTSRQQTELHQEMRQVFSQREEEQLRKIRIEIRKELDELPIEEIIASHPELAEKIEIIRLKKEGQEISLVRQKKAPDLAIPVWSKSKHRGTTLGLISINIPEPRLPRGSIKMEFRSVCACCGSEIYGLKSPFDSNYPKWPEYKKPEGENDSASRTRHAFEVEKYEEEVKKWEESEEGQKNAEWHEQKKQEYKKAMQDACTQNGIKYLAMRKGAHVWADHYSALENVEMMEITDEDDVHQKIDELRTKAGHEKEIVPSFEISR